jgi:hypothetical protein
MFKDIFHNFLKIINKDAKHFIRYGLTEKNIRMVLPFLFFILKLNDDCNSQSLKTIIFYQFVSIAVPIFNWTLCTNKVIQNPASNLRSSFHFVEKQKGQMKRVNPFVLFNI